MAALAPVVDSAPQFVLRLVEGKGLLGLKAPLALPLGKLERLDLEIPNLRFPFDGSGDTSRFRNRRSTVRDAALRLDEEQLTEWLAARPLHRYGLEELRARLAGDAIQLAGALSIGDKRTTFTCRARVTSEGSTIVVELDDLRTYHPLPAAAPLVGLALLYALGARPVEQMSDRPPGFVLRGVDRMEVDALAVALWRSLLPAGWRLPRAAIDQVTIDGDGRALVLTFREATGNTMPGMVAPRMPLEVRAQLEAADAKLAAGELTDALTGYERLGALPLAIERRVATLVMVPGRLADAEALARELVALNPDRGSAITLLGVVLSQRGALDEAAALFQKAAVLSERAGDPAAAIEAALRAAELLIDTRPTEATPLLERVVAGRATHGRAAQLLADRYASEHRHADLLRLEKRRLSHARGQDEEARARVRLGAVWLDFHDDALRARDELERALRLFPGDAGTFRLYARALERSGEPLRAYEAAEQGLALTDVASSRYDRLATAQLAERAGRPDDARRLVEELLEDVPGDQEALAIMARLANERGDLEEAVLAYERAAAESDSDPARARLYFAAAVLAQQHERTRGKARLLLERAREAHPSLEILRAAAILAEEDGRDDDLDELLEKLGAQGDRDARIRRVRLLLSAGRASDAALEAEALATTGDAASLELLVEARRMASEPDALGFALERFIDATRDPAPRIELGRLRAESGDLVRARILLEEALPLTDERPEAAREALELLCDVLMRQGDDASLDGALGRLAALRDDPPGKSRALAAQAAARARVGRLDAALSSYREALAYAPDDVQARLGLAEAAYVLRLWDDARAALERVYDVQPRPDRAMRLGEIAERQSRAGDAIKFYEAALDTGASGADAQRIYVALAALHHSRGEWESEARLLLRAAEDARTPDSDAARAGRLVQAADLLRKRVGKNDEAAPLYDRALGLDPLNLPALDALESLAIAESDWARAAQILSRKVAATAKRPIEQKAILGRLAVMQAEKLGRDDAAREAYLRALALDPRYRPALAFLARDARARGHRKDELERLERLTALGPDPAEPEARLADLARLAQLFLDEDRIDAAEATARRVLSEQPRHGGALQTLDEVFTRGARHAELEALLNVRAQVETDYDVATEILMRRGAVLEGVGRVADAISAYEHITSLRPAHLGAWSKLAELLRNTNAFAQRAEALGRLAEQHAAAGRREEATALFVEQAHVLHDQLSDGDRARDVLERAREAAPGSRLVIGGLLALARGRRDADAEAALLDRLIDLETDPAARGIAVLERARTLVQRGERADALQRLRTLSTSQSPEAALRLRLELEDPAAHAELLEALRARGEADGNVELERFALERSLTLNKDAAPLRVESLAQRLLELDPRHRDALRAAADAAHQRGDEGARARLLERLLDEARRRFEGPASETAILLELGQLSISRGDRPRAITLLREAVEVAPADAQAQRALGLYLADSEHDLEAASHLQVAAELGALESNDHLRLADLYERIGQPQRAAAAVLAAGEAASAGRRATAAKRLGRESEARAAALTMLESDPGDASALDILLAGLSPAATIAQVEELASVLGAARAAALIEAHATALPTEDARLALERAVALEPSAARWARLGALLEGKDAADAWAHALELDPAHLDAALGRAASLPSDEAAPLLRAAIERAPASVERARAALRLGELEETRGAIVDARKAYALAIEDTKDGHDAIRIKAARSLAAVARAEGDLIGAEAALRLVLEGDDVTDADVRALAELLLDRNEHDEAAELLEQLDRPGALYTRALERSGKTAALVAHLEAEAELHAPVDARELLLRASQLAGDTLDDPARALSLLERALPLGPSDAELWERMGRLQRDRLGQRDAAARSFARAYADDARRTHLLQALGDYHHDAGEHGPAADYYGALLRSGTTDRTALPGLHVRLAEYARGRADAIEEEAQLRAAVEASPSAPALRRLVELYRVREDKLRLEQALLQLADLVPPAERLPVLREARDLMGPAPAAELDERILALDRGDRAARDRLLARLRSTDDPSAILERLERELDTALADGNAVSPDLAIDLGEICLQRNDLERASRAFLVGVRHGGGMAALRPAIDALRKLGRAAEGVPLVEAELARGEDAHRTELEGLLLGLLLDVAPERALPLIERARARGVELPVDSEAYRRLLRGQGRFEDLAVELDRAAESAPAGEARLALAYEAAELFEGPLQRPRDAARRFAALFETHATRRDLAARARALYLAGGEPIYALAIVDKELAAADPDEIPTLKITRGEILLAADADAEAEAEFLHALITTKRVGRAHAALADVYRKRGDLASALEHLIAAADAPDLEPSRAAACAVDAADVLLIEGDTATAERLYQLAAALDPGDRRAIDALIRLASAQAQYERQAELLGRAASLTADRRERARLLHERARLLEGELRRDLDAYRAYREAVACDPTLREAVRSLRTLAEARGEWAVAAEQLYREAALADDAREKARIHFRLAQIHEERLFDSGGALRNLEQAGALHGLAKLDESESPWPGLVRLYGESQRHGDAAEAADKLVASLPDDTSPTVRGEAIARAATLHARAGHAELAEQRRAEAKVASNALPIYDPSFGDASPAEQRKIIEDRLRTEPEGDTRVALLRRLVTLLSPQDDLVALDRHAQALLAHAPDDSVAFLARRRVLEARKDHAQLVMLLRGRAQVTGDARERAERRYEAGRVAETQLYDVPGAAGDYEAALDVDADHVPALDALADLAFRTRHLQRARALYERLGDRSTLLAADELARRRGELAEEAGDQAAARTAYAAATALNPSSTMAHQALARVALRSGDDRTAYTALRAVLELLPRDSSDRTAELRRHLGELAARIGELKDARTLLESLLIEDPTRRDVLTALSDVYERSSLWREAAALYERRLGHAERNEERAELLFRQGEVLLRAGQPEHASDVFLKAADLNPRHAPTLRRLVNHYFSEGDFAALQEVVGEIEALGAPLAEAAVYAGLGLALQGDESRGAIVAAMAQPTSAMVVDALSCLPWPVPTTLDAALRTALRAAGGGTQGRDRVLALLEQAPEPTPSARLVLAVLLEQAGRRLRARQQLEVLAFLHPDEELEPRIVALRDARIPEPTAEQLVPYAARGTLRDALSDLGPLCLGLAIAPLSVQDAPEVAAVVAPVASLFGYATLPVGLLDRLADPAWAEPSRPPRLLVQRRLADDVGALRFAAARALHALHAGLALVHGRATEDIAALLRAAAATFLPDLRVEGAFVRAWQAELLALGLHPDAIPESVRARLEVSLATLVVDRNVAEQAHDYAEAERLTASRVAYAMTADLRGGLEALGGELDLRERALALRDDSVLADLLAFALSLSA